jgi:hypothetical protein
MLNGASVARRKRLNPAEVTTLRMHVSPACAPRHSPTSWDLEHDEQSSVEKYAEPPRPDRPCHAGNRRLPRSRSLFPKFFGLRYFEGNAVGNFVSLGMLASPFNGFVLIVETEESGLAKRFR